LHVRTVATILVLFVVALLLLNRALRSGLIWWISIGITVIAVIVYFIPNIKKR